MAALALRRLVIFGAPLGLGALAAVHPILADRMIPADQLGIWTLIHTAQVPLAALLGVAVLLLLDGVEGFEARLARLATVPWIAAFAAYDGLAGLATGALSEYASAHPDAAAIILDAARALTDSPIVAAGLPLMALAFGLVAFGGAGIALHASRLGTASSIALATGGIAWTFIHPLVGAPAMALFALGALMAERRSVGRRAAPLIATGDLPA
jgi:hypothetical protein